MHHAGQAPTLDLERLAVLAAVDGTGSMLATMIGMFRASAPERAAEMRRAVREDDAEALIRAAHRLRGTSANIGASRLSELCAAIDDGSPHAALLLDAVERHLPEVLAALQAFDAAA